MEPKQNTQAKNGRAVNEAYASHIFHSLAPLRHFFPGNRGSFSTIAAPGQGLYEAAVSGSGSCTLLQHLQWLAMFAIRGDTMRYVAPSLRTISAAKTAMVSDGWR